jgi:hypothetical protein
MNGEIRVATSTGSPVIRPTAESPRLLIDHPGPRHCVREIPLALMPSLGFTPVSIRVRHKQHNLSANQLPRIRTSRAGSILAFETRPVRELPERSPAGAHYLVHFRHVPHTCGTSARETDHVRVTILRMPNLFCREKSRAPSQHAARARSVRLSARGPARTGFLHQRFFPHGFPSQHAQRKWFGRGF